MVAPLYRTINAAKVQQGSVYRFGIDPQEKLDFTIEFEDAFPSTAIFFAINGTADYGSFTQVVAPVVDATNKRITLYIAGIAAGTSSYITVKAQMTQDSAALVVEVPFILTARDSSSQLTPPVAATGYYATAADLATEITNRKGALTANFMTISTITASTTYWWMLYVPAAGVLSSAVFMTIATINVSANDTDYWSFEVYRWRAASVVTIGSKHNKNTAGTAITANTPWVIDPTTFDASNKILAAGDVVAVRMVRNGTPAQSFNNGGALVRWTPDS